MCVLGVKTGKNPDFRLIPGLLPKSRPRRSRFEAPECLWPTQRPTLTQNPQTSRVQSRRRAKGARFSTPYRRGFLQRGISPRIGWDRPPVTLAPGEPHRLARIRAAETGTTVSAMMRDLLTVLLQRPVEPEPAETEPQRRARLLDEVLGRFRREGIGVDTSQILTREEMYDRNAAR